MNKLLILPVICFLLTACGDVGIIDENPDISRLNEDYRQKVIDASYIQESIDSQGDGFIVQLESFATYIFYGSVYLRRFNNGTFLGNNTTFKRADSSTTSTRLTRNYTGGTVIEVENTPWNYKPGDSLVILNGQGIENITKDARSIISINGNSITVSSPFTGGWVKGDIVAKSFRLIKSLPTHIPGNANRNTRFLNILFDGNRDNNMLNYSWTFNGTVFIAGGKTSLFENCIFRNIPNECIIGHGFNVLNSQFEDLNGSAIHMSVHDNTKGLNAGASFINNTVIRSNAVLESLNGHAEGAITMSWGGGNLTVKNNYFESSSMTAGVIGQFYSDYTETEENLVFMDNHAKGYRRVILLAEVGNTVINNVTIENNVFENCGNTYIPYLRSSTISIKRNTLINTILPER